MKIIDNFTDTISNEDLYLRLWGDEGVFLDIETTGLKRETSSVYLIGLLFPVKDSKDGRWDLKLILAESEREEPEILKELSRVFAGKPARLITFNGERFDIPFLKKRYEINGVELPHILSQYEGTDIYRMINRYRKAFGLSHMNQKSVERILKVNREDRYSGGELIPYYREYERTGDKEIEKLLITHNREDVYGMAEILSVVSYTEIFKCAEEAGELSGEELFKLKDARISCHTGFDGERSYELLIRFELPEAVPEPYLFHDLRLFLETSGMEGTLHIPVFNGELKHFFENYKDYHYIPSEDTAILKTLGYLREKGSVQNATAANCYIRKSGDFIPLPEGFTLPGAPVFKKDHKSRNSFVPLTEDLLSDPRLRDYLISILKTGFR